MEILAEPNKEPEPISSRSSLARNLKNIPPFIGTRAKAARIVVQPDQTGGKQMKALACVVFILCRGISDMAMAAGGGGAGGGAGGGGGGAGGGGAGGGGAGAGG